MIPFLHNFVFPKNNILVFGRSYNSDQQFTKLTAARVNFVSRLLNATKNEVQDEPLVNHVKIQKFLPMIYSSVFLLHKKHLLS